MKGKKLLTLLNALDQQEFLALYNAVQSPLLNTNARIGQLYAYLGEYYPDFEAALSKPEVLFRALFPGEPYQDYKLRRLLSGFTQLVERFLAILEVAKDGELEKKLARRALSTRNLYGLYEKAAMDGVKSLEAAPFRDAEYFKEKALLLSGYYFHPQTDKHSVGPAILQELSDSLDAWYMLAKFRLAVELRNRENILSEHYQLPAMDLIEGGWGIEVLKENKVYQAYQFLYQFYQQRETAPFQALKNKLLEMMGELRKEDQLILFQQLLNFGIRQINLGQGGFYAEVLALYKFGLEYGLLTDRGRMSEATYSNIALVSCEEGEFEWAYRFINEWAVYVEADSREDAKAHCFSLWHYFRKEYKKALNLILAHRFTEPFQPRARMLELRITFEQFLKDNSYYRLLSSKSRAFERYLRRARTLSKSRKQSHYNTLSLLRKTATAIAKGEDPASTARWLRQEAESDKPLVLRSWLLQQAQMVAGARQ